MTDDTMTHGATTDGATTDGATTDGATTDGATTDGATAELVAARIGQIMEGFAAICGAPDDAALASRTDDDLEDLDRILTGAREN